MTADHHRDARLVFWLLLGFQFPQCVIGLVTLILSSDLYKTFNREGLLQDEPQVTSFLRFAIGCGLWNFIALPLSCLICLVPAPIKPPGDQGRMGLTTFIAVSAPVVWIGMGVYQLRGIGLDECNLERCERLNNTIKIFSIIAFVTLLLTILIGSTYEKDLRKKRKEAAIAENGVMNGPGEVGAEINPVERSSSPEVAVDLQIPSVEPDELSVVVVEHHADPTANGKATTSTMAAAEKVDPIEDNQALEAIQKAKADSVAGVQAGSVGSLGVKKTGDIDDNKDLEVETLRSIEKSPPS